MSTHSFCTNDFSVIFDSKSITLQDWLTITLLFLLEGVMIKNAKRSSWQDICSNLNYKAKASII